MYLRTVIIVAAALAAASCNPPPPTARIARPQPGLRAEATAHATTLTWMAGPAVPGVTVAGFNVYKGATAGGELATPITGPAPLAATTFVDNTVAPGQVAYYVVRAQSTAGVVSAPSNEIRIVTPGTAVGLTLTQLAKKVAGVNTTITAAWTDTVTNSTFYAVFGDGRVLSWGANVFHVSWTGKTPVAPVISICDAAGNCVTGHP